MQTQKTTLGVVNNPHLEAEIPGAPEMGADISLERLVIVRDALDSLYHILGIAGEEGYPDAGWLVKTPLDKAEWLISGATSSNTTPDVTDLRVMIESTISTMKLSGSDAHKIIVPLLEVMLIGLNYYPII